MFNVYGVVTAAALSLSLFTGMANAGEKVKIKDITGREVEVNVPVERVILGEGRQLYFTAALDTDQPFKRIVGWRDDFQKADLDGYNIYLKNSPKWAKSPPLAA
ncbi:ABC-type Fe3+-hydroxamate transport system substrate-binding protein [Agrobacterium vitis]|nr:ABC-type Fe3+-hydroxamate transport system substrate-binding protein [Agrobacterium vitis]MBE1439823.1 ABC-type Fe3+-hydroxamate transport system substrate-binding protein [Agrobacterium vitis]